TRSGSLGAPLWKRSASAITRCSTAPRQPVPLRRSVHDASLGPLVRFGGLERAIVAPLDPQSAAIRQGLVEARGKIPLAEKLQEGRERGMTREDQLRRSCA